MLHPGVLRGERREREHKRREMKDERRKLTKELNVET